MNKSKTRTNPQSALVDGAQAMGGIAVIRSLGQAGHTVHACSTEQNALGFHSNYTSSAITLPAYSDPGFVDFLRDTVKRLAVTVIIPSEGLLIAIRESFTEFAHLLPFPDDRETVYRGLAKWDLFQQLEEADEASHLPPYQLLDLSTAPVAVELQQAPLFLKLDEAHRTSPTTTLSGVLQAETTQSCQQLVDSIQPDYSRALLQGYVGGVGCGVFLLLWQGEVVARFMHLRLHEVPHTGGASSLRKGWWHEGIYQDALSKAQTLGWQGVVMVEYRWDEASDDFYLMEMNCRFWGSLHLALYAGVDFPRLLVDCHAGEMAEQCSSADGSDIACRYTFPRDVQYLWSLFKDPAVPLTKKALALVEFFWLFLSPRTRSDLLYPGDRHLYWRRLYRFIRSGGA